MTNGKTIPIGVDNFYEIICNKYLYIDKTLMIKEFIDRKSKLTLITRPRRWGKTLNLSMLQHFFAEAVDGQKTKGLFDKLAIAQVDAGKYVSEHQGKYPVIFISFKDIKEQTFEEALDKIAGLLQRVYEEHYPMLKSSKHILPSTHEVIQKIMFKNATKEELEDALLILSKALYQHYGKKVIILIDEYDTPLNAAYGKYVEPMVLFMRNFFSAGLKTNAALEQGLMTGILRISQSSMLSGLNNLKIATLLNNAYQMHFGLTEPEVIELLQQTNLSAKLEDIRRWYNGYKVGEIVMYNPWSIINCLDNQGELKPYWVRTADDSMLADILLHASSEAKDKFAQLLQRKPIEGSINEHVSFEDLKASESALWSLLLFAGYLQATRISLHEEDLNYSCTLEVPNREVSFVYTSVFKQWLKSHHFHYEDLLQNLLQCEVEIFTQKLNHYLLESSSVFDVSSTKKPETFYHGFMFALVIGLRETHLISSNRESGLGRYDILVIPKLNQGTMAIILEFKQTDKPEDMLKLAKQAVQQIDAMHYETELKQHAHVHSVLKIGLAFCQKSVQAFHKVQNL